MRDNSYAAARITGRRSDDASNVLATSEPAGHPTRELTGWMVIFFTPEASLDVIDQVTWSGGVGKASAVPGELVVELVDQEYAVFSWPVVTAATMGDAPDARDSLTAAERDVLAHVVAGASNAQIARARSSATRTVANQVASLLRKLGAASRYDLIRCFGGCRAPGRDR